jgi:Protein of unknown function (DUF3060)
MRVAMTIFAAAAWMGAAHAQTKPTPAPAPVQVVRTELAAPGGSRSQTLTHVCTDREDLSLTGSTNKVTLSGACHSLAIRGSGNTITTEQPLDIDVDGNDNAVTWPKVSAEPHLNFVGTGNSAGPQKN